MRLIKMTAELTQKEILWIKGLYQQSLTCDSCNGEKTVVYTHRSNKVGDKLTVEKCPKCDGTGVQL